MDTQKLDLDKTEYFIGGIMRTFARVPVIGLYGHEEPLNSQGLVHIERIEHSPAMVSWQIELHRHYELYQAIWLESGTGTIVVDSHKYEMRRRCVVWLPAGMVHGFEFSRPSKGFVLTASTDVLSSAIAQASDETYLRKVMQTFICREIPGAAGMQSSLPEIFQLLDFEIHRARPISRSANEALLRLLLVGVGRVGRINSVSKPVKITEARIYQQFQALSEANFAKQWTMAQYADALGVTTDRLLTVCLAAVGRGPRKIVHDRLIMEAKRMLVHTSLTVTEIGLQLGFNDPAYFSRFFAKKEGRSARQFRRENVV